MSDGFTLAVEDAATPALAQAATMFHAGLRDTAQALAAGLLARARENASGAMLKVRSGDYVAALYASAMSTDDGAFGEVGTNAPEAVILEYGATIGPHDITPRVADALRFDGSVGEVFAKHVHFPGAAIAPRPVLHAALNDMQDEIAAGMEALRDAFVAALS